MNIKYMKKSTKKGVVLNGLVFRWDCFLGNGIVNLGSNIVEITKSIK